MAGTKKILNVWLHFIMMTRVTHKEMLKHWCDEKIQFVFDRLQASPESPLASICFASVTAEPETV